MWQIQKVVMAVLLALVLFDFARAWTLRSGPQNLKGSWRTGFADLPLQKRRVVQD
jgi:hypothetical protein